MSRSNFLYRKPKRERKLIIEALEVRNLLATAGDGGFITYPIDFGNNYGSLLGGAFIEADLDGGGTVAVSAGDSVGGNPISVLGQLQPPSCDEDCDSMDFEWWTEESSGSVTTSNDGYFEFTIPAEIIPRTKVPIHIRPVGQPDNEFVVTPTILQNVGVAKFHAEVTSATEGSPIVVALTLDNDVYGAYDALGWFDSTPRMIRVFTPSGSLIESNTLGSFMYRHDNNVSSIATEDDNIVNGTRSLEIHVKFGWFLGPDPANEELVLTAEIWDNDSLTAVDDYYSTVANTPIEKDASHGTLANDTVSATTTASVVTEPAHGDLTLNSDGSFTYTPDEDYEGPDEFTYSANYGEESDNATVRIDVGHVPIATADLYSFDPAITSSLIVTSPGVLDNDSDGDDDDLTAALVSAPAHGSLTLNPNGSFTYTPTTGFHGVDHFIYAADDGFFTASTATVFIDVADNAPVAANGSVTSPAWNSYQVVTDEVGSENVSDLYSDPDGDAIVSAEIVSQPAHGSVVLVSGIFYYTPYVSPEGQRYVGGDYFTYRVFDGVLWSNTATISTIVTPHAYADYFEVEHNQTLERTTRETGLLANDVANYGGIYYDVEVRSSHGRYQVFGDGTFYYIPDEDFVGEDSFIYVIHDSIGGGIFYHYATVTINVL